MIYLGYNHTINFLGAQKHNESYYLMTNVVAYGYKINPPRVDFSHIISIIQGKQL